MPAETPESKLKASLMAIFEMKKVTFDVPDPDAPEQGTIFVQVGQYVPRLTEGIERGRMTAKMHIYSQNEQLPLGFIGKQIEDADPKVKKDFTFYDFVENAGVIQNITMRSVSFVFKYAGQYNPITDKIETIIFTE